jgi:hypothetical protein
MVRSRAKHFFGRFCLTLLVFDVGGDARHLNEYFTPLITKALAPYD